MSLRHAWSLLPLSTPSNYLHHTLQPTQQRERGFVVMMEEVRTKQQLIHQLNIWPHYQKSSNCKLKKGWHVGHLFREYEIVECLFRGSVSHWSSSKTSRTKLFFFFPHCSLQCGKRIGKKKELLSNAGDFFQSHISKATMKHPLMWKENRIGR